MEDLKEAINEYRLALSRIEKLNLTLMETLSAINHEISVMKFRMIQDAGAHCTKCGDPITGFEDSLCGSCV